MVFEGWGCRDAAPFFVFTRGAGGIAERKSPATGERVYERKF